MPMNEGVSKSNVYLGCRPIPIERGFVWAVVEYLQELTSAQVEHELGIDTEIVSQSEAGGVLLPVVRKLLAQANKHTIKPTQHIRRVVNLGLEHSYSGHENGRCLLVEGGGDGG